MSVHLDQLKFDDRGLITAVAQDRLTGEVRMVAWMNREAVAQTLETRRATFFSRSRGRLWVKGEESGNILAVTDVIADCDADTLLVLCEPEGPSCHTGRQNCFFQRVVGERGTASEDSRDEPCSVGPFVGELESVLEDRKRLSSEKSYTRSLFEGGSDKIGQKIREEAGEVSDAIATESDERVASEAADVFYHLLVGLRFRNVTYRQLLSVLAARFGIGGHVEKASRAKRED